MGISWCFICAGEAARSKMIYLLIKNISQRARMNCVNIETAVVRCLAKTHVDMYVDGHGNMITAIDPAERTNSI